MIAGRTERATAATTLAACVLVACTHDVGGLLDREAESANGRARGRLTVADLRGARTEYDAVLAVDPRNREAAFGWAFTDLLLLLESPPIVDVLDRCNQPTFDVAQQIFGPDGILAKESRARAGRATTEIHFFPDETAGANRVEFEPTSVLSEATLRDLGAGSRPWMEISVSDATRRDGPWLRLELNPDDLTRGDSEVRPLASGAVVDLAELDGSLSVYEPRREAASPAVARESSGVYLSSASLSGRIRFLAGGRREGDAISIRFEDAIIPASCSEPSCTATYLITGTVEDTVTKPVEIETEALPFGNVDDDGGPPSRSAEVVALEQCSPIDTAFLASAAKALGDVLERDGERLAVVLADPRATSFSYLVPRELLHVRQDLPINLDDVRVLKGAVDIASAALELAAQYQYAGGSLQDLIEEYAFYTDAGEGIPPGRTRVRDFEPSLVAGNLGKNLLLRVSGFDLATFAARLDAGLGALLAAFEEKEALPEGILDLRAPAFGRLAEELAAGTRALKISVASTEPEPWSTSPLYRFHWRAFLDTPLDRERLLLLNGLETLVRYVPANPSGMIAAELNPSVVYEFTKLFDATEEYFDRTGGTSSVIESWLGGIVLLPPDRPAVACANAAQCGDGYECIEEECIAELPFVLTPGAWSGVSRDDWPVFVNPGLRDVLGL